MAMFFACVSGQCEGLTFETSTRSLVQYRVVGGYSDFYIDFANPDGCSIVSKKALVTPGDPTSAGHSGMHWMGNYALMNNPPFVV